VNPYRIAAITAWEALDSRGRPTVGCAVRLAGGGRGEATVPSGASVGAHEAHELRDGEPRYEGLGVRRAVANVQGPIADALVGTPADDPATVDARLRELDGTPQLGRLGANAVLAVSVATLLARADADARPLYEFVADGAAPLLPLPMVNIISGGAHAGRALDVQDFLAVPVGATRFAQAIEWTGRVRAGVAAALAARGANTSLVADEGGLAAALDSNRTALDRMVEGIERAGLRPGADVAVAIDVAATQFVQADGDYAWATEGGRRFRAGELVAELSRWCAEYPVVSIEDPLAEDDWSGWRAATAALGERQVVGDDLFVTDARRLRRGIAEATANAVLIKPNQTGTLTSARAVLRIAHEAGYATVLSARSGETEDSWLADLAVGWRSGQIKVGSTTRSERTAKWNRLLRIEAELGDRSGYAGASALRIAG
jgi:enolase 1/2/3